MRLNALLVPVLALGLSACGTVSLEDAIDNAAGSVCDYYERCDDIGEGKTYASRNACMIDYRGTFQDAWPANKCTDNINPDGYDQCLGRIEITQCGNLLDLANVVLNCGSNTVCGGAQ